MPRVDCGGAGVLCAGQVNEGPSHVTPKGVEEKSREEAGSFTGATGNHTLRGKTRPPLSSKHPPEL